MQTSQPLASAPVQRVIDALRAAGSDPHYNGGGWMAKCPAHEDKTPSLTIAEGRDGTALLKCFAGCRMEAIVAELHLKPSDLFPKINGEPRQALRPSEAASPKTYASLEEAINAATYHTLRDYPDAAVKRYDYSPTYVRVRIDWNEDGDQEAGKTFREISRLDSGRWVLKRPLGKLPLYRFGEIDKAQTVFICEGEKPCDAGREIDLQCTTSGSASSAGSGDWSLLDGVAQVVIFPDNDKPGLDYAKAVASHLAALENPPTIKIVRLPVTGKGDDLADFVAEIASEAQAEEARKTIRELVDAAEPFRPEPQPEAQPEPTTPTVPLTPSKLPKPVESYHKTDTGNAEMLVDQYGHGLRYTRATGWLVWSGTHWSADDTGAVERLASKTIRSMYAEAEGIEDDDKRGKLAKWAITSESKRRLTDMVSLAASMHSVRIQSEALDKDQWLLNVLNGTLDLRTGKLQPHNPRDLITKICPVKFDPKATAPRFERFLAEIMVDAVAMVAFLLRALGYSLTGNASERAIFILHGVGLNGKSTFVNLFRLLLGDYSRHARAETILTRRNDSIPSDLARLRGARFVTVTEIEEGRRMDVARVKEMAGGGDPITCRHMYKSEFEFVPEFKLWIATNHRPIIRDDSEGLWDRLYMIPFEARFEGDANDKGLSDQLATELPGILNLIVGGCLDWQRGGGLRPPDKVLAAKADYRAQEDTFALWIEERVIEEDHKQTRGGILWADYAGWCDDSRIEPISNTRFGERLTERFHKKKSAYVTYDGIGLRREEAKE